MKAHASSVRLKMIEAKTKTNIATSTETKDKGEDEDDKVKTETISAAEEGRKTDSFNYNFWCC